MSMSSEDGEPIIVNAPGTNLSRALKEMKEMSDADEMIEEVAVFTDVDSDSDISGIADNDQVLNFYSYLINFH